MDRRLRAWRGDVYHAADRDIVYDMLSDDKYECQAGIRVTCWMAGDTATPVIGGYFARLMPGMIIPVFDRGREKLKRAAESSTDTGN